MNKKEAGYYLPRWPALQKLKEPQKDCRGTPAERQGTSRIAGISLPMHCKGYLKASSQKYCKQQTPGSKLRSQALCGPAGKTCHRLCQVQMCSGCYTSPLKRWAAEYSKQVRSWLKKKSCKDSRNLASWGASVYFHWKDLKGRMGWTLDADSKGTGWSLEFRNKSHETASLPNMIIWEGSPWRNNCWVH